jgi:hypothetical protein
VKEVQFIEGAVPNSPSKKKLMRTPVLAVPADSKAAKTAAAAGANRCLIMQKLI